MPSSGWWLARMPIEPTDVRVETISTSSLKTSPSGVRTSAVKVVRAIGYLSPLAAATTSSIVPLSRKADSGRSSWSPLRISWKERIVSPIGT